MSSPPADHSAPIALPGRSVLRLAGGETRGFLQGLITANLRHLAAGTALYGAMLSPQGKMLADFFLVDAGADTLLLDVDTPRAAELLARLKMYRLRAKITIEDVSAEWRLGAVLEDAVLEDEAGAMEPPLREWPEGLVSAADPRRSPFGPGSLGRRLLVPAAAAFDMPGAWAAYERRRIALGLMDGSRDYTPDRSLAMEVGLEAQGAIDFAKGCYVGQEVTNRSKHRATLRKILGRAESLDGAPLPAPGTPIMHAGKEIGELRSSHGAVGLAQWRIEEVRAAGEEPFDAGGVLLRALLPPDTAHPA